MIYVMSDIHGNRRRFDSIMDQIQLQPEDKLYVIGDVIDRHPDGINILLQLMDIQTIDLYREKTFKEFVAFVMSKWTLHQHINTAVRKMLEGRDGFYVECVDGSFFHRGHSMYPAFQGIRLIQLLQVMKDLDMLEVQNG